MDNPIKLYYYTAKNGYAWQGCDEEIASSLQRYMEAAGALPRPENSNVFGGATVCQLAEDMGVAVYRYHTIEKGDDFGRDCNLVALAFIPIKDLLAFERAVDFGELLSDASLSSPDLTKKERAMDNKFLMDSQKHKREEWLEKSDELSFSGRSGLQKVSRMFFSETTQLGFLRAEFQGDVETCEATVFYKVFREVDAVRKAAEEFEAIHQRNGTVSRDHEKFQQLEEALKSLEGRAVKLEYTGLDRYITEIRDKLNGDSERNQKIKQCIGKLDGASSELCGLQIRVSAISSQVEATTSEVKRAVRTLEGLVEVARSIEKMPVLDSDDYKSAIHKSLDLQKQVSYEIGRLEVFELLLRCLGEKKMEDGILLALEWLKNRDAALFRDFLDYFEARHRELVNELDRQRGFLENKIRNELKAELRQEREKLERERRALERERRSVSERDRGKWEQKSGTGEEMIVGNDIASNSDSGIDESKTTMDRLVGQALATTSGKKKSKTFVGCALSLIVATILMVLMVGIVRYLFFSPTTEKETRGFDIGMFDVSNQVDKVHGAGPKSDPPQTDKPKVSGEVTTNITNVSTADNQPSNQLKTVTCSNVVPDSATAKPSKFRGTLKDSRGARK